MARINNNRDDSNVIQLKPRQKSIDTLKVLAWVNLILILGVYAIMLFKH